MASAKPYVLGFIMGCAAAGIVACAAGSTRGPETELLRSPEGLSAWQQQDAVMKEHLQKAAEAYRRDASLDSLQHYEQAVRAYLDHGFSIYRARRSAHLDLPPDLISSLQQRTGLLMDVADEYINHGSLAMGEGIASDVVHDYSDLPVLAPAQRRAEAVLLRYRYRQDY